MGRRLRERAVAAAVAAQHGQRQEDLGRIRDPAHLRPIVSHGPFAAEAPAGPVPLVSLVTTGAICLLIRQIRDIIVMSDGRPPEDVR